MVQSRLVFCGVCPLCLSPEPACGSCFFAQNICSSLPKLWSGPARRRDGPHRQVTCVGELIVAEATQGKPNPQLYHCLGGVGGVDQCLQVSVEPSLRRVTVWLSASPIS